MKIYSVLILIFPFTALGGELSYFDSKIDFWGNKKTVVGQPPKSPLPGEASGGGKFPWKTYLDPRNKEFFKEGDYTPPEPFMEIARNPSDENIKNWFEFMKKKNELARRLDDRVREYLVKNGQMPVVTPEPVTSAKATKPVPPAQGPLDPARFKVRMYFESTCPHCRRMFGVLNRLQKDGIEVHALQIDRGPVPEDEKIVPLGLAAQEEVKKHGINGVPYLLIADSKRKALLPPIQGYHAYEEVLGLLKSADQ
ncbi:MAG: conjugal transfer protein TraF [Bdellovibrionaceae bacterium]|nr:conjugal transfer protein TraF [Pseudobdellovibrionaceae bacterium]